MIIRANKILLWLITLLFLVLSLPIAIISECSSVKQKEIVLPIGISFFTFQAISYIVDVYRGNTKTSNKIINVALYISLSSWNTFQ